MKIYFIMKIRKATKRNFLKLNEIKKEFFLWQCKGDKLLDPSYINRGLGSRLAKNLNQSNVAFFVAEEKGDFIGFVGVEILNNPAQFKAKKQGHFFNLYVREEYRGKKISTQLINAAIEWLDKKGIKNQMIKVHNYNKKAHKIYKRHDFQDYVIELQR
jgi:RimJ/RimL family protein N-acetyltransferase